MREQTWLRCRRLPGLTRVCGFGLAGVALAMLSVPARAQEVPETAEEPPPETTDAVPEAAEEPPPEATDAVPGIREEPPPEATPTVPEGLEAPPVVPEPLGPPVRGGYRTKIRPAFWLAWASTSFRNGAGNPAVSLEGSFGAPGVYPVLPLEVLLSTESREFRILYLWWNVSASGSFTGDFGSASFTGEVVKASLGTSVLTVEFLQRIVDRPAFEFYLTAGGDLFATRMEMSSGAAGKDSISETIPILTVGLGLRFKLREGVSFFMSSSALSYSQLLGIKDTFFDVKDTYRNVEISFLWDSGEKFSWGAGWKHYHVGFENNDLKADQMLSGPSAWLTVRF